MTAYMTVTAVIFRLHMQSSSRDNVRSISYTWMTIMDRGIHRWKRIGIEKRTKQKHQGGVRIPGSTCLSYRTKLSLNGDTHSIEVLEWEDIGGVESKLTILCEPEKYQYYLL